MNLSFLKTHAFYLILIAEGMFSFHMWLLEHDARVKAELTIQASQQQITTLKTQIQSNDAAATQLRSALAAKVAAVKTPARAIAAIPSVTDLPLNARPVPEMPSEVTVEAVPLFQALAQCKDEAIQLTTCTKDLTAEKQISAQQDVEIKALKKKPSFLKRAEGVAKAMAIGIALGFIGAHI